MDKQTINVYAWRDAEFNATAEDLLNMFSPFGCVVSVQKIVNGGFKYGVVSYSNADDTALAVMKLNDSTDFLVALSQPMEDTEVLECERDQLRDSLYTPECSQSVNLQIYNLPTQVQQRYEVLSLLPTSTIDLKVDGQTALVMLPDTSTALWLMDLLNNFYHGSKRLHVSFASQGGEKSCRNHHRKRPRLQNL